MLTPKYEATNLVLCTACQTALTIWLESKWESYSKRSGMSVTRLTGLTALKEYTYKEGQAPKYPFGLLAIAGVQLNTDFGGYRQRFTPIEMGRDIGARATRLANATPVKLGLGFQFRSDDEKDVWNFITMLYSTAPGPALVLQSKNGFAVTSKVTYPPDMDFALEPGDDGKYWKTDLSFVMNSWIGQFQDVGLIKEITFRLIDDVAPSHALDYDTSDDSWSYRILSEIEKTQLSQYQTTTWQYKY